MVLVLQGTVLSFYKFCEVIVWFELLHGIDLQIPFVRQSINLNLLHAI